MTSPATAPDRFRRYLQAMPRVALISGLIAVGLHFHLGPCWQLCIVALITGSLITFSVLAHKNRQPQQQQEQQTPLFFLYMMTFFFFKFGLPRIPADLLTNGPHLLKFTLHLLRYLSTLLTFHALTLLLITNPTLRHVLSRFWQRLIEIPPRQD